MRSLEKLSIRVVQTSLPSADSLSKSRLLASRIKAHWRSTRTPDFKAALEEFPELRRHKSLVLDLAFEEYCLLTESGTSVDPQRFVQNHPSIDHSLFRMIDVYQYYQKNVARFEFQWPSPDETLFDFTVLEELGRGALARVYLCTEDKVGRRQVVVKLARGGAYEAAALGKLSHPNIVPIYSVLEDDETRKSGICMPFRGRSTLCDVLDCAFANRRPAFRRGVILEAAKRHTLATDRYDGLEPTSPHLQRGLYVDGICSIGIQLASALKHAHERGIIHADLKPSNVLISPTGTALLLDFNLSINDAAADGVTGGTLPYMSPERIRSVVKDGTQDKTPDRASDAFSLGVILYELLAGKLPFQPTSIDAPTEIVAEQLLEQQQAGCRRLQEQNPQVDRFLTEIVESCLHYYPGLRPASMGDVERLLRAHQSVTNKAIRWAQRHKYNFGAVFSLVLILTVTLAMPLRALHGPKFVQHFNLGVQLLAKEDYQKAIDEFNEVVSLQPSHAEAYHLRGRAQLLAGHYQLALVDFRKAYSIEPAGRNAVGIGFCFSKLHDFSSARVWYRRAVDSGFETPGTLNNLAYAAIKTRKFSDAEQALARAAKLGVRSDIVYLNRARLALDRADTYNHTVSDQALSDIERAISLNSETKTLHLIAAALYGWASLKDQRYAQDAIAHLTEAHQAGIDVRTLNLVDSPAFLNIRDLPELKALLVPPSAVRKNLPPDYLLLPWDDPMADYAARRE